MIFLHALQALGAAGDQKGFAHSAAARPEAERLVCGEEWQRTVFIHICFFCFCWRLHRRCNRHAPRAELLRASLGLGGMDEARGDPPQPN